MKTLRRECEGCGVPINGHGCKRFCTTQCRSRVWWKKARKRGHIKKKRREFYVRNRERILAYGRQWYKNHRIRRTRVRRRYELKQYGLTLDAYKAMVTAAKGRCELCKKKQKTLSVDHCHTSNKVRGLLCGACNRALGLFKDNPGVLRKAAAYLERTPPR